MTVEVGHRSFPSGHPHSGADGSHHVRALHSDVEAPSHRIRLSFLQQKLQNRIGILPDFKPAAEAILIGLIGSTVTTSRAIAASEGHFYILFSWRPPSSMCCAWTEDVIPIFNATPAALLRPASCNTVQPPSPTTQFPWSLSAQVRPRLSWILH